MSFPVQFAVAQPLALVLLVLLIVSLLVYLSAGEEAAVPGPLWNVPLLDGKPLLLLLGPAWPLPLVLDFDFPGVGLCFGLFLDILLLI